MPDAGPRERLLEAVVDHALSEGLGDRSLRAIAAAVGTSHRMLIHHFGSREGLLVEVTREVERRQRELLAEMAGLAGGDPSRAGRRMWRHLCDPGLEPQERLFFELYGQALQGQSFALPLLEGVIDDWVEAVAPLLVRSGVASRRARQDARLMLAVTRGLLLDLLATGDRRGVDGAMDRFISLYSRDLRPADTAGTSRQGA